MLLAAFLSVLGVAAVLTVVALVQLHSVTGRYRSLLSEEVAAQQDARELQVTFKKQVQEWKNVLLRGHDANDLSRYERAFLDEERRVQELGLGLRAMIADTMVAADLERFLHSHDTLGVNYRVALETHRSAGGRDPVSADRMVRGQDRAPTDLLDTVVVRLENRVEARTAEEAAAVRRLTIALAAGALVSFTVLAALVAWLAQRLTRPIRALDTAAREIAAGDLTRNVAHRSGNEIGALAESFQVMTVSLREVVAELEKGSGDVAVSAEMLSASAEQLSAAAESVMTGALEIEASASAQTSSITTASVAAFHAAERAADVTLAAADALNVTSSLAEAARAGAQAASEARERIAYVRAEAREALPAVRSMGERSSEIEQVAIAIAQLAADTDLLSVNAAIEAARAGESGRGFGVVADEMKRLSGQTADALAQVRELTHEIRRSVQHATQRMVILDRQVGEGEVAVSATDAHFARVAADTLESAKAVDRITQATEQQREHATTLRDELASLAATAEENTATASQLSASAQEQTAATKALAAASQELSRLSLRLRGETSRFRLQEG